jgi:hypothetical protein
MERLELGNYARDLGRQAAIKLALPADLARSFGNVESAIDDIKSDNFRGQKAIRNELDPDTATWTDIETVARARACENLGLPDGADLHDIIDVRRQLAREVHQHALSGNLDNLDWQNPETVFAAQLAVKYGGEKSPEIVKPLKERISKSA